ncbi:protein kinase family protein [Actinoplanes sp. NBRC 103695]|uniref:serine/threonine protein kinase n=1 Tax=Actinoplanes sp. NBRC 103695 TaxID=3032202 RepID=UPI0024A1E7A6|nr:protein kinase family protein [Actinoplanes sp. NBRC 103695]GLY99459.1 hypothetical protein Acsp02_67120 [Actinoplanes sp. NBRC 103695]
MNPDVPPDDALLYLRRRFGNYDVKEFLNEGYFGLVFQAVDFRTGISVAMKFLKLNHDRVILAEFDNENELLYKLRRKSHVVDWIAHGEGTVPLVSQPHERTVDIRAPYIVMELAEGCLEELVVHRERLSWDARLRLFRGVVLGVHQMHLNKIVHRDLKSSNCLVLRVDRQPTAKVSDLGRSRDLLIPARQSAIEYLAGQGDYRFAPPELLWMQGVDKAVVWQLADLYGLGSILYELATGQGITAIALGSGLDRIAEVKNLPPRARKARYESQTSDLRLRYEDAFDKFRAELPQGIANYATQLVRQLCDPDPARRLPKIVGRPVRVQDGLDWLIRRVDILAKMNKHASQ